MKVSVIGAGSWGTALAHVLGLGGNDVMLWARKQEVCDGVNERHENPRYLIGCKIDSHVKASTSFEEVLSGASAVVIVTPSAVIRQTCANIGAVRQRRHPHCGVLQGCGRGERPRSGRGARSRVGQREPPGGRSLAPTMPKK